MARRLTWDDVAAGPLNCGNGCSLSADVFQPLSSSCGPAMAPEVTNLRGVPPDAVALSQLWAQSWPGLQPIGHEVRDERERWVRFHALPESKRYPEDEQEYAEVLRRHNLLLGELRVARPRACSS